MIRYFRKNSGPVVDTTLQDISAVLNINTYQKAGWVLHMLRHALGDVTFWNGIQQYYTTYHNGNVMTADFQRIMEETSGKTLGILSAVALDQRSSPLIRGLDLQQQNKIGYSDSSTNSRPAPFSGSPSTLE